MAHIEKLVGVKGITWNAKVRVKGHKGISRTFGKRSDAVKWAGSKEVAMREGRHVIGSEAERHTLAELIDKYILDIMPGKGASAQDDQPQQLAWWRAELGEKTLAAITHFTIAEATDKLAKGRTVQGKLRTPATINRYLAALSHAYTMAVKRWGWIEANPVLKVERPPEARGRVRWLSVEERTRLRDACQQSESPDLYCAMVVALSTGGRRGEIMGLRWGQVDFARRSITLFETKNGEIRTLALEDHAFDLMLARSKVRRIDTDLVFPAHNSTQPIDLRTPFETALRRAEIKNFRWHDLRHTAASYLAMRGASNAELAEFLGHKTLAMVKRYAHLSQSHTSRVVKAMNAEIWA